jgi:NAD(P)-dependent dehydrogenase (short-subunit alcohol dehydrogenase family)
MRVIVVGATGTIGSQVAELLAHSHEVVSVGHERGDFQVDIGSKEAIERLFETVGTFDALVSAAGEARFGSFDGLSDEDYMLGLRHKLMGQVNLVRAGCRYVKGAGSFTLTSGILSQQPMPGSASISMVNAAVEGFVRAAALELGPDVRVNAVSPVWVSETLEALGMDPSQGMPANAVAYAYRESVEGSRSGEVLDVREFAP